MRRLLLFSSIAPMLLLAACHRKAPVTSQRPVNATPQSIDSIWAVALDLYARHKWEKAGTAFDRVELELPFGDKRIQLGWMYIADIYRHQGSHLEAVRQYRKIVDQFPSDSLAPEALVRAGDAYAALWRKPELDPTYGYTALTTYREAIDRYTSSPAAKVAGEKVRLLEDKLAYKAYRSGMFYMKFRAYDPAILYFKDLVSSYPRATIVPDALSRLIDAYRKLSYLEDVRDMCVYMRRQWADAPQTNKACPASAAAAVPEKTSGG